MISIENSGLVDFLPNLDITEEDMMYVYNLDDDFLNKRDSVYKVYWRFLLMQSIDQNSFDQNYQTTNKKNKK